MKFHAVWVSTDRICTDRVSSLGCTLELTNMTATMQLNRYLMDVYKSLPQLCDMKFPQLPEKRFISLAIIEKESVSRGNTDIFTKGTLHGHADEILKKKTPLMIEKVIEPPEGQKNIRVVFVEGAPGIGKSTFALELCRRQEYGKFSLVVLLRLRENRVQKMQNISDLFYQNGHDLQQAVTKEMYACNGNNMLLVLDGFDELPIELRKGSFIVELIQGKHLPECTVVVTSRPSATAHFQSVCYHSRIDKHIEVLGFTQERIKQYAESMLADPYLLRDFLKYITVNPAIHGMMYIPLNSAIVVEIYKARKSVGKLLPRTLTQLYTELCLVLMKKYLKEKNESLLADQLSSLEEIPKKLKNSLLQLGKLALEGTLVNKISFEQLPDGCSDLGFMNKITELYLGSEKVVSYSFLHLTLQEFLAAFYTSQLQSIEQELVFIKNVMITELESSHMDVMWRFMAGLTQFRDISWKLVYKAAYRNEISFPFYHRPLLVRCLLEVNKVQEVQAAFHSVYCTEYYIRLSMPFDCFATGFCVAACKCDWNLLFVGAGGDEIIEMLVHGLMSTGSTTLGCIHELNVSGSALTQQAMTYFSEFPHRILNQVRRLDICNNQLNADGLNCLADALEHMVNLIYLDLSKNPGGDSGMVKVFHKLPPKVEELLMRGTYIGDSDIESLSELLKRSGTNINVLKIGHSKMSAESVEKLVETVLSPSSLREVEFWSLNFNFHSQFTCFDQLDNSNVEILKFMECSELHFAIPSVAKALCNNTSLHTLGIPGVPPEWVDIASDIGDYEVEMLSDMLRDNNTLMQVTIHAALSFDNVQTLNEALEDNDTLEELSLYNENNWDYRIQFTDRV